MVGTDITILGGGCAGLSLATALASFGTSRRSVRIIEPRTTYERDRTWCFWDVEPHLFEDAVTHRWPRWRICHGGDTIERGAGHHRYVEVPADRFYEVCLNRLDRAPAVELSLGERMTGVSREGKEFRVETSAGSYRSRLVFDARAGTALAEAEAARARSDREGRLWQHFVGQFIRTAEPVFDPGAVTLMDFDVDASTGVHFFYVLPYSRTEALVESTYFSPHSLPCEAYEEDIARYLEARHDVRRFEVTGRESGRLPMFDVPIRPLAPGVIPVGLAAGACRPSTGYAFLAIQRQAKRLAQALARERTLSPAAIAETGRTSHSSVLRAMDRILLAAIQRRPTEAPVLFHRLFESADPTALIRFLMEAPRGTDVAEVIRAMPGLRLFRALLLERIPRRMAAA